MTTDATPIDRAHAAMQAAPEDDAARLRFFERLADAELVLLLSRDPEGDAIDPDLFELPDASYLLAFDTEERLAAFTGRAVPYVALSGRTLAGMLAGQGLGLGLNLGAPSETLLPAPALDWLAAMLSETPRTVTARPAAVAAPSGLPEPLLPALDAKLAAAEGLAQAACLVAVTYDDGSRGHLLAFLDPLPGAEEALARATGEALAFSGIEAGALDVTFLPASDPAADRIARVGLRFDIPAPAALPGPPTAPGMDPDRPPRLR